jgi:hypothetical protein
MIYGTGRGSQPNSDQIPKLIELSRHAGAGVYVAKGLNRSFNCGLQSSSLLTFLSPQPGTGVALAAAGRGCGDGASASEAIANEALDQPGFNAITPMPSLGSWSFPRSHSAS